MIRRVTNWVAGAVLGLSAAAWGVSLFQVVWARPDGEVQGYLNGGMLVLSNYTDLEDKRFHIWGVELRQRWRPASFWFGHGSWLLAVPLWMPTAGGLSLLGSVWLADRLSRQARVDHCPACGYDLTGIDGVCPECGGAP